MTELRPGADFHAAAAEILDRERRRLADLLPGPHELLLVGGSCLPGTLTKGDVDLHLRVPDKDFPAVVAALSEVYAVVHPAIWQSTLATFSVADATASAADPSGGPGGAAELPTGVAVTPIGSPHDLRFTRSWRLLSADPALVDAYNAVKLRHRDDPGEYERQESAFFDSLTA
ncbi:hypothetical protein Aab01nite_65100 [Paractinoplanes abujensis]|uniref:GrpB-like predicted nucleotidyltransferase (UPF0157 family) n=1 Tax=Paractinoplanes abujensis TaxID=882441 RepID=A0A7W7CPZ5_9ACTN|nr:hypothetical protein [Actinoplanes abujensis]MBB4692581.1 GrpB-like predicted nucleotidyltransferase (UPF0157 family) [Actinoplanes abujensis]GID22920.1 hypothetical protein Aab01nite_65100 [Actinoplanes abujensis]